MVNYFRLQTATSGHPTDHLFTVPVVVGPIDQPVEAQDFINQIVDAYYQGYTDLPRLMDGQPLPPSETRIVFCDSSGSPVSTPPGYVSTLGELTSRFPTVRHHLSFMGSGTASVVNGEAPPLPTDGARNALASIIRGLVNLIRGALQNPTNEILNDFSTVGWRFERYDPNQNFNDSCRLTQHHHLFDPQCFPERRACVTPRNSLQEKRECLSLDNSGDMLAVSFRNPFVINFQTIEGNREPLFIPMQFQDYLAAQVSGPMRYNHPQIGDYVANSTNTYIAGVRILFDSWGVVHGIFYEEILRTTRYFEEDLFRNGEIVGHGTWFTDIPQSNGVSARSPGDASVSSDASVDSTTVNLSPDSIGGFDRRWQAYYNRYLAAMNVADRATMRSGIPHAVGRRSHH